MNTKLAYIVLGSFTLGTLGTLGALGCSSSSTPEPTPANAPAPEVQTSPVAPRATIAGYRHLTSASKFRLGPEGGAITRDTRGPYARLSGPEGVLAITENGATLGVPNANAPSLRVPALSRDPAVHEARVLKYFLAGGIPADQIGPTHVTTQMRGSARTDLREAPKTEFIAYTTVVDRQIDGIRVAGSYAWARFNANDDVVAEEVYWPELPSTLLAEARELRARLDEPETRARFRAALPHGLRDQPAEVVIRHAPHNAPTMTTLVSIEATSPTVHGERHFAIDGRELHFDRASAPELDSPKGR